jgi:hypothetical protein
VTDRSVKTVPNGQLCVKVDGLVCYCYRLSVVLSATDRVRNNFNGLFFRVYWVIILAKSSRYCSDETKKEKHNLLRLLHGKLTSSKSDEKVEAWQWFLRFSMNQTVIRYSLMSLTWKGSASRISLLAFVRTSNTSWPYMASPWKDFCRFISSAVLYLRVLTTGFKLRTFLPLIFAVLRSLCWIESISTLFCENRLNG